MYLEFKKKNKIIVIINTKIINRTFIFIIYYSNITLNYKFILFIIILFYNIIFIICYRKF